MWCIGEHATLSRWKDGFNSRQGRSDKFHVSSFKLGLFNLELETEEARYANRKSDQAQTLERVGSTPTRATGSSKFQVSRSKLVFGLNLETWNLELTLGPLVYRQDTGFSTRRAGFNSPADCSGKEDAVKRNELYRQCRLVKKIRGGETIQTSYLPAEFAKKVGLSRSGGTTAAGTTGG